jgi:1-phosphofructokinase
MGGCQEEDVLIHTITLNPSIDLTVRLDRIRMGEAQQLAEPLEDPAGKGMNVARALQRLGIPVTAWVFLGGERGKRWIELAQDKQSGIESIWLQTETRQNIKIFEEGPSRQTDLNFPGSEFEAEMCGRFLERLSKTLTPNDIVVLAGSQLRGTPYSWWTDIVERVQAKGCRLVVDMTGPGLMQIAKCSPWLIKINRQEFNEWYGLATVSLNEVFVSLQNRESILSHLVVTDGPGGALLWTTQRHFYKVPAIKVDVAGTVGAGDAFTAGLLAGWLEVGEDWENAMRWGIATASGAVELPGTRFPSSDRIRELLRRL